MTVYFKLLLFILNYDCIFFHDIERLESDVAESENEFFIVVSQTSCKSLGYLLYCTGLNFINILRPPFLYESVLRSISLLTVWLCIFLAQ